MGNCCRAAISLSSVTLPLNLVSGCQLVFVLVNCACAHTLDPLSFARSWKIPVPVPCNVSGSKLKTYVDSFPFPSGILTFHKSIVNTRTNSHMYQQPVNCSTNYYKHSFVPHSIFGWNTPPATQDHLHSNIVWFMF